MKPKKKVTKKRSPSYWDHLLPKFKPRKARPKPKAIRKPKPKPKPMPKKKAEHKDADTGDTPVATADALQPREGDEEFLPPPDPPFEESLPRPPATGYEVSHQQKGAQPEDDAALREMKLSPDAPESREVHPEEAKAPEEEEAA